MLHGKVLGNKGSDSGDRRWGAQGFNVPMCSRASLGRCRRIRASRGAMESESRNRGPGQGMWGGPVELAVRRCLKRKNHCLMQLRREDFLNNGFTEGCPWCQAVLAGIPRQGQSE